MIGPSYNSDDILCRLDSTYEAAKRTYINGVAYVTITMKFTRFSENYLIYTKIHEKSNIIMYYYRTLLLE